MVISLIKINRNKYNKLRQDALALYGQMIVSKTFGNAKYVDLETQIADLKAKSLAYDQALLAAAKGGTELVFTKNQAKAELLVSLDCLANLAEVYAKGNEAYIVEMGFEVRQKSTRPRLPLEAPETPIDVSVKSTGNPGEAKVTFVLPNPEHVVNVAVEHRVADTDASFVNGLYIEKEEMILKGLPQLKMVEFRFRAIGREGLRSDWTMGITVPVL